MKRTSFYTFFICLLTIFACQHELHLDQFSDGILVKSPDGNCLPITVAGNFIINKLTNDSNFLNVHVEVTVAGKYVITTDSVNGYSFKAAGVFNNTGNTAVKLACSGRPLVAGTDHFNIRFNNSRCEAVVRVLPDTVAKSNYTLNGSPGTCMYDSIAGNYIQSVALDTSDKVIIRVNVITPGTYSIFTGAINGYSFSASGIFTTTGTQTVILTGAGIPAASGNNLFTVTAGSGTCNFSITVVPVVPVINQSYFPLTDGSYWTYRINNPSPSADTITRNIKGDTVINSLKYARMNETTDSRSSRYLFNLNYYDYTEFGSADKYTSSFQYGSNVYGLLPFLKEHLALGQSWESEEFRGTASFGQVIFVKYYYACLNNNAAITLNGQGFKDVYIIAVYPQIRSEHNSYGSTGEIYQYYYAKGIGLIYLTRTVNGIDQYPMQIRSWHIN